MSIEQIRPYSFYRACEAPETVGGLLRHIFDVALQVIAKDATQFDDLERRCSFLGTKYLSIRDLLHSEMQKSFTLNDLKSKGVRRILAEAIIIEGRGETFSREWVIERLSGVDASQVSLALLFPKTHQEGIATATLFPTLRRELASAFRFILPSSRKKALQRLTEGFDLLEREFPTYSATLFTYLKNDRERLEQDVARIIYRRLGARTSIETIQRAISQVRIARGEIDTRAFLVLELAPDPSPTSPCSERRVLFDERKETTRRETLEIRSILKKRSPIAPVDREEGHPIVGGHQAQR